MGLFRDLVDGLRAFTPAERRNIVIYILGIMMYKFGLEAFNGSIVALATNRYDYESITTKSPSRTFERVGLLTGLNQAFQCVGSILIAPLNVLAGAVAVFGVCSALLLIIDAATDRKNHPKNEWSYYGKYNTDAMIPVYCVSGIAYGMVELIRRVIPRDIVGGDVQKLRKMDSIVHIFYEITGTAGAFTTGLVIIPTLGNNMAFIITPVCFALAALIWSFLSTLNFTRPSSNNTSGSSTGYLLSALRGLTLFGESILVGCRILFSSRKFIWLVPGYAVALYAHRYLENGIAPQVARRYLGDSAWSQIMVGGSNLGELLGALCVLLFTNVIHTPMPWLRLDALFLLAVWYIPFWHPPSGQVGQAWLVAATFMPISFGWAAGDVSLAAYIQASLARLESKNKNVSALGAVMAFLYSFYIVTYAIMGTVLGRYLDGMYNSSGGANGGDIRSGLVFTVGVQFSVIAALVLAATFVPRGAVAFNPRMVSGENLERPLEDMEVERVGSGGKVTVTATVTVTRTRKDSDESLLIIAGASGLVATEVIRHSLRAKDITTVLALARRPVAAPQGVSAADAAKLRSVVIKDYETYSEEARKEFSDADACIWTVAITPTKSKLYKWEDVVRICQTSTLVGMRAMVEARQGKPFRFLYMSGLQAERDQTKRPWLLTEYVLMRGETENRVLAYAAEQPGGSVQACVAKPSIVTSAATPMILSVSVAALRMSGILPSIGIEELAAAMVQQIRDGFEKEPLMNDDLKRIGREALAKEKAEEAKN
ncbi:hypothetical protein B0T16DRAFT_388382 [Cercophora newfieldiana]|uniref:Uncharacterized protein n=1 Tax=Cercophora newfieldiana TaxID=92897 RepID=A0AA40CSS3_9PEZI|nr:hypothetical protein B0T16DRAFT_388382 [Cercophora newfieldiana]